MRALVGVAALAGVVVLSALIAAGGSEAVPAAAHGPHTGWLDGVYGGGLGLDGGSYLDLERDLLVLWIAVLLCASAIPSRLLRAGVVVSVLAFVLAPPLLSLDVFSYASHARLEALHGLNPYVDPPASVPGDQAVAYVGDFRDNVSPYGPLFTLTTAPLAHLGLPGFLWLWKALVGLSVLGIAWLVWRLAANRGLDPRPATALVALNPLVLVHVVGGGHNDALMVLLLTAGVAGVLAGRELLGGAGLAGAAGIKAAAGFALPFALVEGLRRPRVPDGMRRGRLLAGLAGTAVLVTAGGLLVYGSAVDSALSAASANQNLASRASLPSTISREAGIDLDAVRVAAIVLYGLLVAGLLVWTARGADWIRAAGWAGIGLLLATTYVTPWYVIWVLPLSAISRDRALVVSAVAVSGFLLRYQVAGLGG